MKNTGTNGDSAVSPATRRSKPTSRTKPGRPRKPFATTGKGRISEIDATKFMVKPTVAEITIEGLTPLLVNQFGAKAIKQMLDIQKNVAKPKRGPKDPFSDFMGAFHVINSKRIPKGRLEPGEEWPYVADTFGFPANAIKMSMVSACGFVEGITKVRVRGVVHIHGNLLPLKYSKVVMRQDTVRVGKWNSRTADIRFRPEFHDWSIKLKLQYNKNAITIEQVAMLLNNAGFAVGLGEWRPEHNGSHGTFAIA